MGSKGRAQVKQQWGHVGKTDETCLTVSLCLHSLDLNPLLSLALSLLPLMREGLDDT